MTDPISPSGVAGQGQPSAFADTPPNPNLDPLIEALSQPPEPPAPEPVAASVAPTPEAAPAEPTPNPTPEPPPDPRAQRRYASRAINLSHGDGRLEGTFYQLNGQLHPTYLEGSYAGQAFDSLDDLFRLIEHTPEQRDALMRRLHHLLLQPNRFPR